MSINCLSYALSMVSEKFELGRGGKEGKGWEGVGRSGKGWNGSVKFRSSLSGK